MRSEGRITDEEFESLTEGIVTSAATIPDEPGDDEPTPTNETLQPFGKPSLRQDLAANYVVILFLAAAGFVVASSLGLLTWLVSLPAILLLITTLFEGWRKVTLTVAALTVVVMLIGFVVSAADTPEPAPTVTATLPPQDPYPPIPGSLDIYMDQVTDSWNTVDGAPQIVKGLTRHNETGDYDTFIYRFGEWGRLAGAYDPETEAIYALLVTGQFSAEATDQLYLHLCFMAAPYSQECVDSYHQHGLDGGTLDDFADIEHEAEWALGEDTWRLRIEGNVMTIRVFGSDAA
jgi:hypothetical protein